MSGTSMDGIDVAYLESDGEAIGHLGGHLTGALYKKVPRETPGPYCLGQWPRESLKKCPKEC